MSKVRQKRTPWFTGGAKPVNVGVYEIRYKQGPGKRHGFAYWDGLLWGWTDSLVDLPSHKRKGIRLARQDKEWRGVFR